MNDTARERIDHAAADHVQSHEKGDPVLVAALEAVMALHKEVNWPESWPTCIVCNNGEGYPLAYPCDTVAAITTALEDK